MFNGKLNIDQYARLKHTFNKLKFLEVVMKTIVEFSVIKNSPGLKVFSTEHVEIEDRDVEKIEWPENAYRARFLSEVNGRMFNPSPYYYYEGRYIGNNEPREVYKYCNNPWGFVKTRFGQYEPLKAGDIVISGKQFLIESVLELDE